MARANSQSIAVLPFENASNDPNTEYLSEGISEALINSLTELRQLRVIARATAFRYSEKMSTHSGWDASCKWRRC